MAGLFYFGEFGGEDRERAIGPSRGSLFFAARGVQKPGLAWRPTRPQRFGPVEKRQFLIQFSGRKPTSEGIFGSESVWIQIRQDRLKQEKKSPGKPLEVLHGRDHVNLRLHFG